MRRNEQLRNKHNELLSHLECVTRISNIPIVETSVTYAGQMYTKIKNSNSLVQWTLGTAEFSLNTALEVAIPSTVAVFGGPINAIDKLLCKSLDIVEQRVPNIYLPPHLMYSQTKDYVSNKFVSPVLKRADSMKQIGNQVLASKYTEFAVDKLDVALNVADMYIDKYLPDAADQVIDEAERTKALSEDESSGKAVQTIHHVDRFSRKLQRRLTKRTLAEAKALKERSRESIHVLLYVAELVATDPKQALEKARELWNVLSENEPENQARPTNLEQLIVMLTRESARRVVHFINFTRSTVGKLPVTISKGVNLTTRQCRQIVDHIIKTTNLEGLATSATDEAKTRAQRVSFILTELNSFASVLLERMALMLAGQSEIKKQNSISSKSHHHHHHHHRNNHHAGQNMLTVPSPLSPVTQKTQTRATPRLVSNINNGSRT